MIVSSLPPNFPNNHLILHMGGETTSCGLLNELSSQLIMAMNLTPLNFYILF